MGAFCDTYGKNLQNSVLEFTLENQDIDFAVSDITNELRISKPKAYEIIRLFETKGYVIPSRIVGKTQLFRLNKENKRVQLFMQNFRDCLKLVVEENSVIQKEPILARVFLGNIDITERILRGV